MDRNIEQEGTDEELLNDDIREGRVSDYICEDCHAVVEAMMKGEKTTCPECGGSVVEHTPEPANE